MHVTVLCPGPSLVRTFAGFGGLTIGVNRAAIAYGCDWWAALDSPLIIDGEQPSGSPRLFTSRETFDRLVRNRSPWADRMGAVADDLLPPEWRIFTAPAALALAAYLGATRIDVYGADWTDAADFDGVTPTSDRSTARWAREIPIWAAVVEWLGVRGTRVETHGHS